VCCSEQGAFEKAVEAVRIKRQTERKRVRARAGERGEEQKGEREKERKLEGDNLLRELRARTRRGHRRCFYEKMRRRSERESARERE